MSDISTKLTYLNETKSQLKNMINNGLPSEEQITSSTTFRNYVSSIFKAFLEALRTPDTLFTNLPKKSGTGANITLNDTANAPMRIMLNASELTQAGTPTPSSPQDIHTISGSNKVVVSNSDNTISQEADIDLDTLEYCKIGNYEDKFIRSSGKNLFDINDITLNTYLLTSGATGTSGVSNLSGYIKVKANQPYYLNYKYNSLQDTSYRTLCYYDTSKTYLSGISIDPASFHSFTPAQDGYIRFSYDKNYYDIMLNEGTTALEYEPYGSNEWYIKKNIGKVVLDGSETWSISSTATSDLKSNTYTGLQNIILKPATASTKANIICNYYNTITANQIYTNNVGIAIEIDGKLYIYNSDYASSDITAFKTWLNTHNTEVYYVLSTPTYTPITGTLAEQLEYVYQMLKSQKGQTNISQVNNDLPFVLDVEAIEEL